LGKKSSLKSAKKRFLYSQEHRDRKMGTKNARNNFPRNTRIVRAKNVGKKSSLKSAKKRFLYSRKYRDKKMGTKKCTKQFFQKHMNTAKKKFWEKIVLKK